MSCGALVWIVSTATRLPLISIPLFVALGIAGAGAIVSGVLWALLCLLLTGGLSTLYLEYLRHNVRIGDPARLAQGGRLRPLRVISVEHLLAWALVSVLGVPFELGSMMLLYALLVTLLAVLAPEEEVSLHAAGVCGAAIALAYAFGPWGLLAALLLAPVWWAKIITGRHSAGELASGALAGTIGGIAIFLLTGG